ncbi:dephospho-CoA kinase [Pelagibacteraceae bacterium]|jgi:dephospho-CoA kinase|nr:dephospho-CoA kinase [Pelagibacteraceae bacterium]
MVRIAVIGGIGYGKSYIAKLFGYPVFNADNEVSKLYKKNRKCYKKLKKELPKYINSFPIKKNLLSKAINQNKHNLKKIIKIIHPEIRFEMEKFIKKNRKKRFIVLDIPLLIENKLNKKDDILIFVDAKKKEVINRLKKRPNFNQKLINKFKALQLSLETKKKRSDFIIKNNFKNKSAKNSVKKIKENFLFNA